MTDRIIDKARIVQDPNGTYRVRAESSNGEIVFTSEQYENHDWATKVAHDLGVPVIEEHHAESGQQSPAA